MRGDSFNMWRQICDLILLADSTSGVNREDLAGRWVCTPRNVSHVLAVARRLYGVQIESQRNRFGTHRYVLTDPGVFNLTALRKHARRARAAVA